MATKNWRTLSKKDKKHLKDNGITCKWQMEQQVKNLKETMQKYPSPIHPCQDCESIARKLGMWGEC